MRNDLTNSLISTINDFDDSTEFAIDKILDFDFLEESILDNQALKDIPIINVILGIRKLGISVRDHLFIKNLLKFLNGFKDIPKHKREKFLNKYFNDPFDKKYFSEKMITTIESIDFSEKIDFIVLLIKKRIDNEISSEEFFDLLDVIKQIKFHWIKYFFDFAVATHEHKRVITEHYYLCGLLQTIDADRSLRKDHKLRYVLSPIGKLFLRIYFNDKLNDNYIRERIYFHFQSIEIHKKEISNEKGQLIKGDFIKISKYLDQLPIKLLANDVEYNGQYIRFFFEDNVYLFYNLGDNLFALIIKNKIK